MATVPLSGTNVRLLSGVPFSNDYKHTRWFDTQTQQKAYFDGKPKIYNAMEHNFQRIEGKHYVSVNKSIDELWNANYMMFQNAQYNNKWFYAFVTKLEYIQKKTTYVHFEIDVFQTWRFDMDFKPSYVIREHRPQFYADSTPVINTIDEGLDYGRDYEVASVQKLIPFDEVFFMIVVAKNSIHGGTADTPEVKPIVNGLPQPLSYYVIPFKLDGTVPKVEFTTMAGIPLAMSPVAEVMKAMYTQEDAVNNIVSIYVTEHIGDTVLYTSGGIATFDINHFEHVPIQDDTGETPINVLYLKDLPKYKSTLKNVGKKYSGYRGVKETKLMMYPYTVLVLDDFKGNRIELKNEYIEGQDLLISVRGSLGTSNKVSYSVANYLNDRLEYFNDQLAVSLENSLISNNPNDVPIITELLSAYLQGNKNQIANQQKSITFNGIMNNLSTGVGGIASAGTGNLMGAGSALTGMVQGTGNSILSLQQIQAKQKDIDNTPPSMTKMGSNTAYDFGNGYTGIYIIKKQITKEYQNRLEHFFNMFGYKTNEVKIPNFHTRQNWNYVQTESCYIAGNFNNDDLQELKSVFDNGITLWHTDDVGNYALENGVI